MSRSTHRFRPEGLELFESRIVPSGLGIVADVGDIPFVPPGHTDPALGSPNFYADSGTGDGLFHVTGGTTITTYVKNLSTTDRYVTVAIYTAPGGGNKTPGAGDDNSAAQRLAYQKTYFVPAGQTVKVELNVEQLLNADQLRLIGQGKFQCDLFEAPDANGYAINKLNDGIPDGVLISGEIFDSNHTNNGKKK